MQLPIFPLKLVVFPGEKTNLHIFEDRYKELINDCEKEDLTFGIPVFMNGRLHPYGCELRLEAVKKRYKDGKIDVSCRGQRIFRIKAVINPMPNKLYAGAEVSFLPTDSEQNIITNIKIFNQLEQLYELLAIDRPIPETPEDLWAFDIAHHIGLSINQEYELMTKTSEIERQEMILDHLTHFIPAIEEMERLKERVKLNGHFKHMLPPEF